MLAKAVTDFNISDEAKRIVLLGMQNANIEYLNAIGFGDSSDQKTHRRYEEKANTGEWVVATGGIDNTVTTIPANVELLKVLHTDMIVHIEQEQVIVDTVDITGGTFTIKARGHAGTGAIAHSANARIVIIGTANPEWVLIDRYTPNDTGDRRNFFQEIIDNIHLTTRAIADKHKDRINLLNEQRTKRMREHLERLNIGARVGSGAYDSNKGQHTIKGYEKLITEYNGISQLSLAYANGTFDLNARYKLQFEFAKRGSRINFIHTNAQTKDKLINMVGSSYQRNENRAGSQKNSMGIHYDRIVLEKIGGELYFIEDNSIVGYQMSIINTNDHLLIPKKHPDGSDWIFKIQEEKSLTNSVKIFETLQTLLSLEVMNVDKQAYLPNLF